MSADMISAAHAYGDALVDAARAYRAGHAGPPSAAPVHLPLSSALHCLVKYDASSGSVLPPFSVLRIAGTLTDVDALCAVEFEGITGAITGRAIYEGTLDFAAAQARADELNGDD